MSSKILYIRWALGLGCLLTMSAGCSINHSCGTTLVDLGGPTAGGGPIAQGGYWDDEGAPMVGEEPFAWDETYHDEPDGRGPVAGMLHEPTLGPRLEAAIFSDEPEAVQLPSPQQQRIGRTFVPVPTMPVFGPGTEPPPSEIPTPPPAGAVPVEPHELPSPQDGLRPVQPFQPGVDDTRHNLPRGVLAEPARLASPKSGQSWTFQPARAAPLGRDQRFTPPLPRATPRPPARALQ